MNVKERLSMEIYTILEKTGKLVELTATFHALYGKDYRLKPGSPQEAWALYDSIYRTQVEIANLLDSYMIDAPHYRYGQWWERLDVMDVSIAQELLCEVSHLIACMAHHEVQQPETDYSYVIHRSQSAIAGMLHPAALQVAASLEAGQHAG